MARPAEPGQTALLEAGRRLLADEHSPVLTRVSVNAVVAEASMSKGSFYQHWPDRASYLVALHRAFHDRLETQVRQAMATRNPGADRLRAGIYAYLDGCLREHATKSLLVQARHEPALAPEVAARDAAFTKLAVPDIARLGWKPPQPAATLLVAMVAATALTESSTGHAHPAQRAAILHYAKGRPS